MPSGLLKRNEGRDFLEKISDEVIDIEADYILALRLEISDVFADETEPEKKAQAGSISHTDFDESHPEIQKIYQLIEACMKRDGQLSEEISLLQMLIMLHGNPEFLASGLSKEEGLPKADKEVGSPDTAEKTQDFWAKVSMDEPIENSGGSGAAPAADEGGGLVVARGGSPEVPAKLKVPRAERTMPVNVSDKGVIENAEPEKEPFQDVVAHPKSEKIETTEASEREYFLDLLHKTIELIYSSWPLKIEDIELITHNISSRPTLPNYKPLDKYFEKLEVVIGEIAETNRIMIGKIGKKIDPRQKVLHTALSNIAKDIILKTLIVGGLWELGMKQETITMIDNDIVNLARKTFY